ncbi:MAG: cobalamin-dependent protein [Candidatus Omnitrophica bacterium]|nr:cobalamin-dependent protein [Candidatus Omnitrophota bacterium]
MRILLVNPPFEERYSVGGSRSIRRVLNIISPLGLAYLAAVLEKNKFSVKIIDCTISISYRQLFKSILEENPEVVGITATTSSFESAKFVARHIKEILPGGIIIIGGAHITAMPEATLKTDCFDIGVLGEAEETFLELVRHIEAYRLRRLDTVKGIAFKSGDDIINTGRREFIHDLDRLPLPARHLLPPLKKYHPTPASYKRLPLGVLITSRGCPCQCIFCDRAIFGNITRLRGVDNVLDEVEELIYKYGAREIRFFDDLFTLDIGRTYKICEGLQRRKLHVPWTCLTGANFVTKDLLKTMKSAGCWQVLYGLESADSRMLKSLNKGNTLEQNIRAVRWAQKVGLNVRADFIVGVPGDTLENMERTLKFAINMKLDYAHFNKFVPFPGTAIYKTLINQGYKFDFAKPCSILDHATLMYVSEGVAKIEYMNFLNYAFKKFYLRPHYILNRLISIRTWDEFKGQVNGLLAIMGL